MYILQVKHEQMNWVDMLIKESPHDLTEKYMEMLQSFSLKSVRIIKTVEVSVNTTVEVVK